MKVLFAVSNENISTQIVKKYQKEYKEIISYKNMYYFNAVVKELQRDKSYDRIVIGEDLEPFSNNNYDAIDKFIFEKLDNISDEATGSDGDIPIILICSDRREKSDPMLVKLFGLGIYNALLGQDRSIDNVCKMLNKPRSKKDAKNYYKIDSEDVNYQSENEDNVSEVEIKNILAHYKRLGKNEDRYVESFNNIAAQYTDNQLRIITKFLPLNVKAVLEEKSPKYQSVMTFGEVRSSNNQKAKKEDGLKVGYLNSNNTKKLSKPVIVPTAINKTARKLTGNNINSNIENNNYNMQEQSNKEIIKEPETDYNFTDLDSIDIPNVENTQEDKENIVVEPIKRGRGRPKKNVEPEVNTSIENKPKRGRGRPKKSNPKEEIDEETTLPGFEDVSTNDNFDDDMLLPGFDNTETEEDILPGFNNFDEDTTLPGFDNNEKDNSINQNTNNTVQNNYSNSWNNNLSSSITNYSGNNSYSNNINNVSNLLSKDKKVVAFVGTTKNGTSFLVNNLGKTLSNMGIKTAILDLTTNRNSYYIFTNNDERLRGIAYESIKKLRSGIASGISIEKNLDVYTALPGDNIQLDDVDNILSTLIKNYSLVLMDCDFSTPAEYFGATQELYIVQSLDILTIQPMTAFLRELKAKDLLREEKIRVVINKEVKVKGLTPKAIIGGLAFYNDPSMSFMTELFNKDTVKYATIPFDEITYARYLENVMDCEISINGYSKDFNIKLKELANMVYPLIGNKYKTVGDYSSNNTFSSNMNNTLEQMRKKY